MALLTSGAITIEIPTENVVETGNAARYRRASRGMAAAVLLAGTVGFPVPAAAAAGATPPLHERFGDWEVTCAKAGTGNRCAAVQQQGAKSASGQTVQRTIAIELVPVPNGAIGTLLTPFGVDLAKGVVLRLDKAGPPLPFKTCLPTGCVVALQFGKEAVQALRARTVLHISFVTAGDGRPIDLPISLNGLGQALDRLQVLQGDTASPNTNLH
jgi:invasion protein IalB